MNTQGKILSAINIPGGKYMITAVLNEISSPETLDALMHEDELDISLEKYREKRSLNANSYFWVLIDKIAKKLHTTKMDQYYTALYKYGAFIDVEIINKAIPILRQNFRYLEILDSGEIGGEPASMIRCYRGSSTYDKTEMQALIDGTVEDAKDLGIETLTPSEIARIIAAWEGNFNGKA